MTDMEYIRMRQEEGRSGSRGAFPAQQHTSRLAALLRLTRRARDGRPAGGLQRQS